ncbi:MAG: amino acid ABC transporter permease [Eubacterium sp.]|nr:amino acid ABC transporter permease [Eubacterium sp.]MDD7209317.1 amino acid ABC transporter permease [Lachnospiraceae bacterium]MDY5498145.1 amino acid ABC transporter permease [Anaerobutyricum sp.]
MDVSFMQEQLPLYVEAAKLTLHIAVLGIILAIIVGLICSMVRYFKVPVLQYIAGGYIELSRNTPLLIQLFFLYFGLPKLNIVLSSEQCAVIGLAFLGGSYMAEAFRSGLDNVAPIQVETALSLGMTKSQVFGHIILPQAVSNSIPAFCANVIFLIKETSVFSAVALADLMFITKDLIGIYYKTDESLFMLVMAYLIILLPISILCTFIERRVRYAEYGD